MNSFLTSIPINLVSKPLVTIGLTTFNSIDTVDRAFRSAINQTWRPIEVVAVDDASTDKTLERLQVLASQYPELRVFSNTLNSGVAVSRNRILAEARGEFVIFFDDDDESHPDRIFSQYSRIVEYERDFAGGAPVICHTARRVIYPHGESRNESTMGQVEGQSAPAGPAVARRILMGESLKDGYGACPTCSQMARVSTYQMVGGFDPALRRGEDTDFNIRLAEVGGHFVGICQAMVTQFMTLTSEKSLAEEFRNMLILMEKHRTLMELAGQYEFCIRWLHMKQAWLIKRPKVFIKELSYLVLKYPLLTWRRLVNALPNIGVNQAFSLFHKRHEIVAQSRTIKKGLGE